jgi:phenylalanyl-tRNA synthetase beta chain
VIGLARELAAGGLGTLKDIKVPTITTDFDSKLKVQVEDDNICPHFVGYHIKDVTNRPSPDWLQNRLKMIGLTPISAIVDITNYICFSYFRPLHAYDAGKLSGNLKVRVTNSEKLTLLNDKEYQLSGEEIVVADETKPLGLAGIMGSLDAACDMETKEIFLEAALFNPLLIAKAGRKHSLQSDARYRFERQVDPAFTEAGLAIAAKMITDICGGKISQIITGSKQESKPQIIHFRLAKIKELGGTDLAAGKAVEILKSLGFAVQPAGEILQLTVPSWRNDIEGEADIVEEVIRVNGYQHLIEEPLPGALDLPTTSLTRPQKNLMTLRRLLASRGLNEVVSWSFMSSKKAELFGPLHEEMTLQNPINRELDYMRPSIIGNMLGIIQKNHARSLRNLSCFEIGPIFAPAGQELVITGIREGKTAGRSIYPEQRNFDVYDIKADFIAVLNEIGLNFERFESSANVPSWYHPKRASAVQLGKNIVGYFGELHPSIIQQFGVKSNVVAFEILIGNLPQQKSKSTSKGVYEVSDYPKVERDYAFVLDQGVTAAALLKAVKDCEKNLITKVELFDVYESDSLGDNKKSLALTVTFQAKDRTLTDGEIEVISHKIIANVKEKLGGELRAS